MSKEEEMMKKLDELLERKIGHTKEYPTADVVERKKGEWEICGSFDDLLRCSNCRFKMPMIDERFNFCPECGADMREEQK